MTHFLLRDCNIYFPRGTTFEPLGKLMLPAGCALSESRPPWRATHVSMILVLNPLDLMACLRESNEIPKGAKQAAISLLREPGPSSDELSVSCCVLARERL